MDYAGSPMYGGASSQYAYLSTPSEDLMGRSEVGPSMVEAVMPRGGGGGGGEMFSPPEMIGAEMIGAEIHGGVEEQHQEFVPAESYYGGAYAGDSVYAPESATTNQIRIPFKIIFQPYKLREEGDDYIQWNVKTKFPRPFSSPGDASLNDDAVVNGIMLEDVSHDFKDDLLVQVSLKNDGDEIDSVKPDAPDDFVGQRLYGTLVPGQYKKVPVHAIIRKGDSQDVAVLNQQDEFHTSYLENLNSSLPEGASPWTKSRLETHGVNKNTMKPGTLLVANTNPVLMHIDTSYRGGHDERVLIQEGTDHTTVSERLFHDHLDLMLRESARNIKMGDLRNNLKVFATRDIGSESLIDEGNIWVNPQGIFDHISSTINEKARADAQERVVKQNYTLRGNLAISYVSLSKSPLTHH